MEKPILTLLGQLRVQASAIQDNLMMLEHILEGLEIRAKRLESFVDEYPALSEEMI